jgi:hypothetical protein
MKFVEPSPFTDPDAAARKLMEIANATEPAQDGRIYIEQVFSQWQFSHPCGRAMSARGPGELKQKQREPKKDGRCSIRASALAE